MALSALAERLATLSALGMRGLAIPSGQPPFPALRHGIGGSIGRVSATVSRTGIDGRSFSR